MYRRNSWSCIILGLKLVHQKVIINRNYCTSHRNYNHFIFDEERSGQIYLELNRLIIERQLKALKKERTNYKSSAEINELIPVYNDAAKTFYFIGEDEIRIRNVVSAICNMNFMFHTMLKKLFVIFLLFHTNIIFEASWMCMNFMNEWLFFIKICSQKSYNIIIVHQKIVMNLKF